MADPGLDADPAKYLEKYSASNRFKQQFLNPTAAASVVDLLLDKNVHLDQLFT